MDTASVTTPPSINNDDDMLRYFIWVTYDDLTRPKYEYEHIKASIGFLKSESWSMMGLCVSLAQQ